MTVNYTEAQCRRTVYGKYTGEKNYFHILGLNKVSVLLIVLLGPFLSPIIHLHIKGEGSSIPNEKTPPLH